MMKNVCAFMNEVAMVKEKRNARESIEITIRNKYVPLSKTEDKEEVGSGGGLMACVSMTSS